MAFTGFYHVGAREYDPKIRSWLQRDPNDVASGDPNLYRYAGNDPVNQVDPDGLQDSGLWKAVDIGIGFVPIVGSLWDIGVGLYEGDYCRVAFGVASLAVDVATVGSARVAAGTARAAVATARTVRGATEVRTLVLLAKGGARVVIDPDKLRFANSQKLTSHFRKHGHEFGVKSEQEYLEKARAFVRRQGILHHVRNKDGAIVFFDPQTGELAVVAADGKTLLTYFRPRYDAKKRTQDLQKAWQYWQHSVINRGVSKMRPIVLPPKDREKIAQFVESHYPDTGVVPEEHIRHCIEAWEEFVSQEVELGYEFGLDDYLNDLGRRDDIEEVLRLLSLQGYHIVMSIVEPIDQRFRHATRHVERSVWYPAEEKNPYWWYHRVPKRMGDDLRRDLRTIGIIR